MLVKIDAALPQTARIRDANVHAISLSNMTPELRAYIGCAAQDLVRLSLVHGGAEGARMMRRARPLLPVVPRPDRALPDDCSA